MTDPARERLLHALWYLGIPDVYATAIADILDARIAERMAEKPLLPPVNEESQAMVDRLMRENRNRPPSPERDRSGKVAHDEYTRARLDADRTAEPITHESQAAAEQSAKNWAENKELRGRIAELERELASARRPDVFTTIAADMRERAAKVCDARFMALHPTDDDATHDRGLEAKMLGDRIRALPLTSPAPAAEAERTPYCSACGKAMQFVTWDRPGGPPGNGWACPECSPDCSPSQAAEDAKGDR
ncbi:MAG TPA: hypothetical protein VMH39_02535 [Gemmatimonadaceae bacterium]|nr:hypothetical protein [Gemmatimonadaceae bacterium]